MNDLTNYKLNFEETAVSGRIYALLCRQCQNYCGVDSSSISYERAEELLSSLLYTLSLVAEADEVELTEVVMRDAEAALLRGTKILDEKRRNLPIFYQNIIDIAPEIDNIYYLSTMSEIGCFFKRYEIYFSAHEIPCSIDYQLLRPVPESRLGISFIEEYLYRISLENQILRYFDPREVEYLQQRNTPNYNDVPLNLCEPIFKNAIGIILCQSDRKSLIFTQSDCKKLAKSLQNLTKFECDKLMTDAAVTLCNIIPIRAPKAIDYLCNAARDLVPRLSVALENDVFEQLFM